MYVEPLRKASRSHQDHMDELLLRGLELDHAIERLISMYNVNCITLEGDDGPLRGTNYAQRICAVSVAARIGTETNGNLRHSNSGHPR